jgi:hypothetical protein
MMDITRQISPGSPADFAGRGGEESLLSVNFSLFCPFFKVAANSTGRGTSVAKH